MFDLTTAFEWAKEHVGGVAAIVIPVAVLFGVRLLRTVLATVQKTRPGFLTGFTDWCLVGGVIGAGLGLAMVEPTASGAVAGLILAMYATAAYEYITRGGKWFAGAAPDATQGTVAPLVAICLGLSLLAAGCMGPYLDPSDPVSVAEAGKDVEAAMEAATLLMLRDEEADAARAADLALVLSEVETALETGSQEAIDDALAAAVDRLADDERDVYLYTRIVSRASARARHRLSGLDYTAEDALFLEVARKLTAAGVRGARLACEAWPEVLAREEADR